MDSCGVAIALYESLDQAKCLLHEADAEKEQLKHSCTQSLVKSKRRESIQGSFEMG